MKSKPQLFSKKDVLPLNALSIKVVDKNESHLKYIKYIAIDKYETTEFITSASYRPISKLL
jgi:hypothetical protein